MRKLFRDLEVGDVIEAEGDFWLIWKAEAVGACVDLTGLSLTTDRQQYWPVHPDYPITVEGHVDLNSWKKNWAPGKI